MKEINKFISTGGDASRSNEALFDVSFLNGKFIASVLANQGVNTNLIRLALFNELTAEALDTKSIQFDLLHTYPRISGGACIDC